jgi:hypothetical protein
MKKLLVENVYSLSTKNYTADYAGADGKPYHGPCIMGISRKEYLVLKKAKFPCKEFTQVVLAKSKLGEAQIIRQVLIKHIAYADVVDHTNF